MATALEKGSHYFPPVDGRKPLYHEALVGFEIAELLSSQEYLGRNIPPGDESPVIVVPGFLSKDRDTSILRDWLRRIGYNSRSSGILFANINPEYYEESLIQEVDQMHDKTGKRVHLVGHSLGGIMVRAIAARRPEKTKSVTTLGSPLHGEPEEMIDPAVLSMANWLIPILRDRERLSQRKKEIAQSIGHRGVRITSIYTRRDGVVDWRNCVDPDLGTENIEVNGSHSGLIFNKDVYGQLGKILSKPQLAVVTQFPQKQAA